jgi:HlyD family secretion protein
MKKWIGLAALIAVGIAGYEGWTQWQKSQADAAGAGHPTTALAELRSISFAVNAAGEIGPAEQVSVRPEVNGLLQELAVDVGDRVKKGQLMFKLIDKELQQQRASAVTDVEKAKLELEKGERDFKRAQQLLADKLISQELYDDTKTTFELAKNALERSQRDLAVLEERLTKMDVRAPFDCTVLTRPVSVGQAVAGSAGYNAGTEVLTIADLNSMIINAQVNQADVPRLKAGQTVEVDVEAVPGLCVTGVVERVYPQATIKNNIKGYPARVVLKNVDPRVRPGMTANVKIPVASAENVTAVPLAAVFTEKDPETTQWDRYVYVQRGKGFERRPVKVGVADYFFAEVQEGLKPGETVATEMPKEEREKKAQLLAAEHAGLSAATNAGVRPPAPGATNATKTASAGVTNATDTAGAGPTNGTHAASTSAADALAPKGGSGGPVTTARPASLAPSTH